MAPSLRELAQRYDIKFKKGLGQNLLLDDNINRIMVEAAGLTEEDYVIEVGAGLGALTTRLAKQAGQVLSVEIDPAFMPCLEDQFGDVENVTLFRGDILNHEIDKLINEFIPGGTRYKMISNLPYYITTPILFEFWETPLHFDRMVVMVQEEVGMRMTAAVNASDYGVLALLASYYADVDIVHKVPASCFVPAPKVDSCIVRMRNREVSLYPDLDGPFLIKVIRSAFAQRRKTLRNSLVKSGALGLPADSLMAAFEQTEIDPSRRPQTLSLHDFATLARAIKECSLEHHE
jgi:16S rRNA (adenine1518-N6/adenine1519-N6)-dimethyltransferase